MDSVSLCNLALMMLGIPVISSFDDNNNNAKMCKNFFPVLRDRCLRDHTWSFARAAHDLQILSEKSFDPKFSFVCALPGDCIRVIGLIGGSPFRRIGDRIYVDVYPATVEYVRRVGDAADFDETFSEALQYLLAAEMGMANTRDPQLIHMYRQEYEKRLAVARAIDSQEDSDANQPSPRKSNWLSSRRGSGSGGDRSGKTVWTAGDSGIQGE